ncbi:hypothetical protein BH23GEM9_BH23GEM9_28780 [soil metagenome]
MRPPAVTLVRPIAFVLLIPLVGAGYARATPSREASVYGGRNLAAMEGHPVPVLAEVADPRLAAADAALLALSPHVPRSSSSAALKLAFRAYHNYRAAHPGLVTKPYLYYVDLGLDNRTARGYVFDMDRLQVVDGPFMVSHGTGSSRQRNGVPTTFSNRPGSKASSLGLYLAEETYDFNGKAGGGTYTSIGLRLRGESGHFNDAARRRGVVAHGAPYVSDRDAGRSEGCPALEQHRARRLLPLIADGGVVFVFSPNDARWLADDPWINAE